MKNNKMSSGKFMFTIKADDSAGLRPQIIFLFNRRKIEIISVSAARTGILTTILIHIEVKIEIDKTENLKRQINKVVKVCKTQVTSMHNWIYQKTAFFKFSKKIMSTSQSNHIAAYGAEIIGLDSCTITVSKTGNGGILEKLHKEFQDNYLLGFAQSGKVIESEVMNEDDEDRIIKLVA